MVEGGIEGDICGLCKMEGKGGRGGELVGMNSCMGNGSTLAVQYTSHLSLSMKLPVLYAKEARCSTKSLARMCAHGSSFILLHTQVTSVTLCSRLIYYCIII